MALSFKPLETGGAAIVSAAKKTSEAVGKATKFVKKMHEEAIVEHYTRLKNLRSEWELLDEFLKLGYLSFTKSSAFQRIFEEDDEQKNYEGDLLRERFGTIRKGIDIARKIFYTQHPRSDTEVDHKHAAKDELNRFRGRYDLKGAFVEIALDKIIYGNHNTSRLQKHLERLSSASLSALQRAQNELSCQEAYLNPEKELPKSIYDK